MRGGSSFVNGTKYQDRFAAVNLAQEIKRRDIGDCSPIEENTQYPEATHQRGDALWASRHLRLATEVLLHDILDGRGALRQDVDRLMLSLGNGDNTREPENCAGNNRRLTQILSCTS